MREVMEAREQAEHHEENPFLLPVAVTLSILAVLVAIATLLERRPLRRGRSDIGDCADHLLVYVVDEEKDVLDSGDFRGFGGIGCNCERAFVALARGTGV
jgi:hypothetical protein